MRMLILTVAASALVPLAAPAHSAGTTFRRAVEVRLPSNASTGPPALTAIECLRPGSCVAGGYYVTQGSTPLQTSAMLVTESAGRWARAREIALPGHTGLGAVNGIDCAGTRSCVAVGDDNITVSATGGFAIAESNGKWGHARLLPFPPGGNASQGGEVTSVACTRPASCVAVGDYVDAHGTEPMVITDSGGRWQARELRSPADAKTPHFVIINSVSCPHAGSCTAVGEYIDKTGAFQALAATESGGRWHQAAKVAAPAGSKEPPSAEFSSVACTGAGSCVAAGFFTTTSSRQLAMVATQAGGRWRQARALTLLPPGAASGSNTRLSSVACRAAGSCVAIGDYKNSVGGFPSMVLSESAGKWIRASELALPANAAAGSSLDATAIAVDCTPTGYCTLTGYYANTALRLLPMAAAG